MRTVIETPEFKKQAATIWSEDERLDLISWLAANPTAGTIIPGTGGARKLRWQVSGRGKRGGARVIYFIPDGDTLWLIAAYTKNRQENMPVNAIKEMKDGH